MVQKTILLTLISVFRRDVEICALLGYYADEICALLGYYADEICALLG
jgi:hypothetical protein